MKVLLVNGSPHERGSTYTALREVAGALERSGVESEIFWIGMKPIYGCIACGRCRDINRCIYVADCCNELIEKIIEADGLVVGSPVYFGGPNGALCALLDRVFYARKLQFAGKPAASVVCCRRAGATAALDRLNKYFSSCRMPLVSSQYWNIVHGYSQEDVVLDKEGMQTMRTLGDQMAYWLRCQQAAGVPFPQPEPGVRTNFIQNNY